MFSNRKFRIALLVFSIVLGAAIVVQKVIYKAHPDINTQTATYSGSAEELIRLVKEDRNYWQNKIVMIDGPVNNIGVNDLLIAAQVYCQFDDTLAIQALDTNDRISIKGRLIAYDELLDEIKIDQCIIIK